MDNLTQFNKKQYLNLETFRKSGDGVKTPVWFCQDGEKLYVLTFAHSGKVKRVRNNGCVNVTPCKMDGTPTGAWSQAVARQVTDAETIRKVDHLMNRKYGLLKKLFRLNSGSEEHPTAVLELELLK